MFFSAAAFSAIEQVAPISLAETIPAQNTVEQVTPTNPASWYSYNPVPPGGYLIASTPDALCSAAKVAFIASTADEYTYTFSGSMTYIPKWNAYYCFSTTTWVYGKSYYPLGWPYYASLYSAASCPVASPAYQYNDLTALCELTIPCPAATPRYTLNSGTNMCERPAVCPIPTLYPDIPYAYNSATQLCERTVPDTSTISLTGLGGDVKPTETRTAYALVTSGGSPKSGARVNLSLTVAPDDDGQPDAAHVGTVSPNSGTTGADGRLNFVFTAPAAGGTHTIAATCDDCTNNPVTGTIKVSGCPVGELADVEDIPPNGPDVLPLTLELERTRGASLSLLPNAQAGVSCIKGKYPGAIISSGTRTIAYQQHFIDIWSKMIELNKPENKNNPACKVRRDHVIAEKGCDSSAKCKVCQAGSHCLKYKPAVDSNHPKGDAFDVSEGTIDGLLGTLRPNPPPNPPLTEVQQKQADIKLVADWLASPTACNLKWGGSFDDNVHFQIP